MSKAVLIMDMPRGCLNCRFLRIDGEHCGVIESCGALETAMPVDIEKYDKPDWCPLRELPEKQKADTDLLTMESGIVAGWNACLDEILE